MPKRHKIKEEDILRNYVLLVKTLLMNVYDGLRIKDSWRKKSLTAAMLDNKRAALSELGEWIKSDNAVILFDIFGACINISGRKMRDTFLKTHKSSVKFIKLYERKQKGATNR